MRLDSEQFLNRFDVLVILSNWVLELRFVAIDDLCPPRLIRASKDPTLHILRLDDKKSKPRYDDMIDLRRTTAARKRQVFEHLILMLIQELAK